MFVQGGSVGAKVNDDIDHYFQTMKGLRQGDPISPILFNVVADMLANLIARVKEDGQVGGLIPHLVDGDVSILQYAEDTIIFMKHDMDKVVNVKLILCLFEQLSGLKISFHKSELFYFGNTKTEQHNTSNFLVARLVGSHFDIFEFPFTFAGSVIGIGRSLGAILRKNSLIGRASFCLMELISF